MAKRPRNTIFSLVEMAWSRSTPQTAWIFLFRSPIRALLACKSDGREPTAGQLFPVKLRYRDTRTIFTDLIPLAGYEIFSNFRAFAINKFILELTCYFMETAMSSRTTSSWRLAPTQLNLAALAALLLALPLIGLVSCGGSGGGQPTSATTPPETYTVNFVATGTGVSRSIPLTLTVQ
jgi:hypothetical protein